jgi:hypothetical protein
VKSINAHSEVLPTWALTGEKETHTKEALNVLARLYKSQPVKKVVDQIIEDLKEILGVSPASNGTEGPGKKARQETTLVTSKALKGKKKVGEMDIAGSTEDESDEFEGFDSRIADPSSEDYDSEDSVAAAHARYAYPRSDSDTRSDSELSSSSISESDDSSGDLDSARSSPDLRRERILSAEPLADKPAKSTFLPSLTMGGYMSGSESEASDLDEHFAPKKKNRRGQRARQQIWEKRFGDKAKHLDKKKGDERSKGWDPKRGATLEDDRRGRGRGRKNGDTKNIKWRGAKGKGAESANGANAVPVAKKKTKRDDVGTLHPSWQAAKAAKEKKMNAVPQGKKVVFD